MNTAEAETVDRFLKDDPAENPLQSAAQEHVLRDDTDRLLPGSRFCRDNTSPRSDPLRYLEPRGPAPLVLRVRQTGSTSRKGIQLNSNDKRLIEVAFPLKQASLDSMHEKNVRHGHVDASYLARSSTACSLKSSVDRHLAA